MGRFSVLEVDSNNNKNKFFNNLGAGCGQLGHPNIAEMPKDADNCNKYITSSINILINNNSIIYRPLPTLSEIN